MDFQCASSLLIVKTMDFQVPFFAVVVIGAPIYWCGAVRDTMDAYEEAMRAGYRSGDSGVGLAVQLVSR